MKKKYLLLHFILLLSCMNINAQTDSINIKRKMIIKDVYVPIGFALHSNQVNTLNDFKKLAPQSVLIDSSFNGYSSSSNTYSDNTGFVFSTLVGINFLNHSKTAYKANPQFRFGISFLSGISLSRSFRKEVTKPYDTLTSSQTSEIILIDSVITDNYSLRYRNEQLRLHTSFIFRTNPQARWTLYGGVGINAGISFNAHTEIIHSNTKSTGYSFRESEYITEEFINKNGFGFSAFIPLGIDFRWGKKREFWKRLHAYYELSPQIDFTSVPELRTFISSGVTSNFGLRISVD